MNRKFAFSLSTTFFMHPSSSVIGFCVTFILSVCMSGCSDTVESHIKALKDEDHDVRRSAEDALVKIGNAAVPHLTVALEDEHVGVRMHAARALWRIGPDAKTAVPNLTDALKDEHVSVRVFAANALLRIGPDARAARSSLTDALEDEDKNVRILAANALWRIGPDAKAAILGLIERLKDENTSVRGAAAIALGRIATALQDRKDTTAIFDLRQSLDALREEALGRIAAARQTRTDTATAALAVPREEQFKHITKAIDRTLEAITALKAIETAR